LRNDLIVRRQQTPRGVFVVVKDPASGDFYRFGEAEDFILQQLDGVTPLEEIRRRAESRFGAPLPDGALACWRPTVPLGGIAATRAGGCAEIYCTFGCRSSIRRDSSIGCFPARGFSSRADS